MELSLLSDRNSFPNRAPRTSMVPDFVWGGRPWPPLQVTPTSQVRARRLMAELLRPNMTAKKELRFFCSLRL